MALLSDIIVTYGNRVIIAVFTLGVDILLARMLGPEGKGTVRVLVIVPLVISQILSLSIAEANIYHLGRLKSNRDKLVANSFIFTVFCSILFFSIFFANKDFSDKLYKGITGILPLLSAFIVPLSLTYNALLGVLLIVSLKKYNRLRLAQWVFLFFGLLALMALYLSVQNVICTYIIVYMLLNVLIALFLVRPKQLKLDFSLLKSTLIYGAKTHLGATMEKLQSRIDQLLVNYFIGAAFVGYYSVSAAMAECLWFVPAAMGIVLSSKSRNKLDYLQSTAAMMCRSAISISFLIGLLSIFIFPALIKLLYGAKFQGAIVPFLILLPGVIAYSVKSIISSYMVCTGKSLLISKITTVSAVTNICLNIILIPSFGINGAAFVSSVTYFISAFLSIYYFMNETSFSFSFTIIPNEQDFLRIKQKIVQIFG